jgi:DNA-binding CsgD family transcriptional regulator
MLRAEWIDGRLVIHLPIEIVGEAKTGCENFEGKLTPREKQTLALLVKGKSNKEIAGALGLSERTAKFHVASLLAKAGTGSRLELATRFALRGREMRISTELCVATKTA